MELTIIFFEILFQGERRTFHQGTTFPGDRFNALDHP